MLQTSRVLGDEIRATQGGRPGSQVETNDHQPPSPSFHIQIWIIHIWIIHIWIIQIWIIQIWIIKSWIDWVILKERKTQITVSVIVKV